MRCVKEMHESAMWLEVRICEELLYLDFIPILDTSFRN